MESNHRVWGYESQLRTNTLPAGLRGRFTTPFIRFKKINMVKQKSAPAIATGLFSLITKKQKSSICCLFPNSQQGRAGICLFNPIRFQDRKIRLRGYVYHCFIVQGLLLPYPQILYVGWCQSPVFDSNCFGSTFCSFHFCLCV